MKSTRSKLVCLLGYMMLEPITWCLIRAFVNLYYILAEVPSVAWVLNGLTVDAVYLILLLYPPETPVPSLSCRNLLLASLICPLACWFLLDSICKGLYSVKFDVFVAGINGGKFRKEEKISELFSRKLT